MSAGCWELVATDKPEVVSEALPDLTMVENSQGDGCFPDSASTDESDWTKIFSETDDLLN